MRPRVRNAPGEVTERPSPPLPSLSHSQISGGWGVATTPRSRSDTLWPERGPHLCSPGQPGPGLLCYSPVLCEMAVHPGLVFLS